MVTQVTQFKNQTEDTLLAMEGVYALGGPAFLAHAGQKVNYIVGLRALRLAFFIGFE